MIIIIVVGADVDAESPSIRCASHSRHVQKHVGIAVAHDGQIRHLSSFSSLVIQDDGFADLISDLVGQSFQPFTFAAPKQLAGTIHHLSNVV